MEERLRKLKEKKLSLKSDLSLVEQEIGIIERKILDANVEDYKGKWFYKTESYYDEDDKEYNSYKIMYIENVYMLNGNPAFNVKIIHATDYYKPDSIRIENMKLYNLQEIKRFKDMNDFVLSSMDDCVVTLINRIIEVRPSLRKVLLENLDWDK